MAFKRKKPIIQGTAAHKEALKLNKTMDKSSMPDGRPKSSAFQKKTDKSPSEKYDKPQLIPDKDSGTWKSSGRPKKYKALQEDGTYKSVTNPSGKSSKSTKQLESSEKNYVTKAEDKAAKRQQVESLIGKANKKSRKRTQRKQTIKNVKKKVVSVIKDPLGIKYRKKKKRQKAYEEVINK